ncbi:CU044_5270 family protein [Streptomyces sparsogenes]|uniref:CU044_5270 family protein n=1 Tax=Streptomyces sparsogenes TaxID=67365 RepID=UPI0033CA0E91
MDEVTAVRDFRANAPTPDRARLAPGRQTVLDAAAHGTRVRRLRADWRLASLGVAAVVVAAALVATQLGPATGGRVQAGTPRPSKLDRVMEKAAYTLQEHSKVREPGPHQWIYTESAREELPTGPGPMAESLEGVDTKRGAVVYTERWYRYDGRKSADLSKEDKQFRIKDVDPDSDERTPREWYQLLSSLPTDPGELLKTLRKEKIVDSEGATQAEHDFTEVRGLLGSAPLIPPDTQAALYRALEKIPGAKVSDGLVKDAAGRDAMAVTFSNPTGIILYRHELLLDPVSFDYAGYRKVAVTDFTVRRGERITYLDNGKEASRPELAEADKGGKPAEFKVEKGQLLVNEAMVSTAVVDRAGQR